MVPSPLTYLSDLMGRSWRATQVPWSFTYRQIHHFALFNSFEAFATRRAPR
jgi:hypothetical protein